MRITVFIYTVAVWMCMAGVAPAADLNILRTDTGSWPMVRVVVQSTDIEPAAEAYSLALPSGEPVRAAEVVELLDQPRPASMVVAVDTSRSLSPEHLQAAQDALARYVDRLTDNEQLSLLAFNDNVQLVAGFTSDREAFKRTLSTLKLGGRNTELYRAMLYGVENLKNIPGQRNLMVITDGKDEGTAVRLEDVVRAARENDIRIMVVGLPTLRGNEPETYLPLMQAIAEETGGIYRTAASARELGQATYELLVENQGSATHVYEATFDLAGTMPQDSTQVEATLYRRDDAGSRGASFLLPVPERTAVMASREVPFEETVASGETGIVTTDTMHTPVSSFAATNAVTETAERNLATEVTANTSTRDVTPASGNTSTRDVTPASTVTTTAHDARTPLEANRIWPWIVALLALLGLLWVYFYRRRQTDLTRGGTDPLAIEFPDSGMRFPLKPGTMVLGSGSVSDIRLDDPGIADSHVEFCTGDGCEMRPLSGSRGTVLLNGKPVETNTPLKPGDTLLLGSTKAVITRWDGQR